MPKQTLKPTPDKHFLDTSVARSMIVGTIEYKKYFSKQFKEDRLFVSRFVQMEFRRSLILNLIAFHATLKMPSVPTIQDALILWSHRFKKSALKAVTQITGDLFATEKLDPTNPHDKVKALLAIGRIIKRLEVKLKILNDTAINSTRCARAGVALNITLPRLENDLKQFVDKFNDVTTCRDNCRIDNFLLSKYRTEVEKYVAHASGLAVNKKTKGFRDIAQNLEEVIARGPSACSCKRCEAIGDAVIALDAPRTFRLEHTDHSFDYLCDIIGQPHQLHPSEVAVHTEAASKITP